MTKPEETRQAGAEIEVTEEMRKAGAWLVEWDWCEDHDDPEEFAAKLYRAMELARKHNHQED